MVNPADIHRRGRERHTNTDRTHAELISRELRDRRLESIVFPWRELEQLLSLFRHYNDLVKAWHWDYQFRDNYRVMCMTPRAHRLIPSYFVEAAWQAIRADPVMQAYYRKHLGKDTKEIIIKVARKLPNRTLAVIKTETPYVIGVIE